MTGVLVVVGGCFLVSFDLSAFSCVVAVVDDVVVAVLGNRLVYCDFDNVVKNEFGFNVVGKLMVWWIRVVRSVKQSAEK